MLYAPPITVLYNVKQREGETLPDYYKRFNDEVPRVRGATDKAVKNFLIAGHKEKTKFSKSLQVRVLETLFDSIGTTSLLNRQKSLCRKIMKVVIIEEGIVSVEDLGALPI